MAEVDRVAGDRDPDRAPAPDRAEDRDDAPREVVDRLLVEAVAVVPPRRDAVARRPEAAFDCEVDAADPRAVDLGLMPLRINRIRHRSPVHLTGHTGGVSDS